MDGKIILVLGGVTSGVGKGVVAASIGHLLQLYGHSISINKFDGLLNTSFEQMNPYQLTPNVIWTDEEITILNDGSIVDSDLGVYERFTGLELTKNNLIINGSCWEELLNSQKSSNRRFGEIIAIHPHLTNIYKQRILSAMQIGGVNIFEIGGTIGDYESEHFLRTMALMKQEVEIMTLLVSYVPTMVSMAIENTPENVINQDFILKPAKQSYHSALALGLLPDILILRSQISISNAIKLRISNATGLSIDRILSNYNVNSTYHVPNVLKEQGVMKLICDYFSLPDQAVLPSSLKDYANELETLRKNRKMRVALIGSTESWDSYVTLQEAIDSVAVQMKIGIDWFWVKGEDDYIELSSHLEEVAAFIITEGKENTHLKKRILKTLLAENRPTLCISYGARLLAEMLGMQIIDTKEVITGTQITILDQHYDLKECRERHRRTFRICADSISSSEGIIRGWNHDKSEIHVFTATTAPNCTGVVFHPEYTSRPLHPNRWIMENIYVASKQKELNVY